MSIENSRTQEIKRLTTPFTFKDSKAYDSSGNLLNCVEGLTEIRYPIEPKQGILSDEEVLKYSGDSKAAAKIRLNKGIGGISDVFVMHDCLMAALALYYTFLLCVTFLVVYGGNKIVMFAVLILAVLPLAYLYSLTKFDKGAKGTAKSKASVPQSSHDTVIVPVEGLESLKKYEKEVNNLNVLFDVKEKVVRSLIEKRFAPPQITYDKFISLIDTSHELFYSQSDAALNIIHLAAEDTARVEDELQKKINTMKTIINQIEDLTNELVININSDEESKEDVKNLLDEMESLIGSVKEY